MIFAVNRHDWHVHDLRVLWDLFEDQPPKGLEVGLVGKVIKMGFDRGMLLPPEIGGAKRTMARRSMPLRSSSMKPRRNHLSLEDRWFRIRTKLEQNAHYLRRQGCISSKMAKGRRVWSVRFFVSENGKGVQRAVYLGDEPELLNRARIESYRQQTLWAKEIATFARLAKLAVKHWSVPVVEQVGALPSAEC